MTTRKSGFFALALMTAVFAACEKDAVIPVPPVEVEVVPAAISVDSGSTGTLVAVVRNATNSAVTWASSDQTVATVNANGVVTGVKPGQATITATSVEDADAKNAASVTVLRRAGQGGNGQPQVAIRSITFGNTNTPVVENNVAGQIEVTVDFEIQNTPVTRLEVLVDQTVACSQSFSSTGSADVDASEAGLTIICSVNTAEVQANGTPRFANGPHTITARLVTSTGQVAATSNRNLTFNNLDQLALTATASGATANDAQGLVWATGDVTATATPAIFSGATNNVARVIFTVRDANTNAVIATIEDTSAPFSATFSRTATATNVGQNVANVEAPIYVTAASVTTGGQPGPQGQVGTNAQPAVRLDNDAPDNESLNVVAFNNPGWFSTSTVLTGAARVDFLVDLTDEGVNRNAVTLQYNTNAAATNTSTGWTAFTDIAALPETNTTTELAFRAVVCDALNNCTNVGIVQGGVDRSAPSVRIETGPANNAINPATELQVVGTDAISGVDSVRVRISGRSALEIDAPNADTDLRCYDAAGAVVSTNPTSGACPTRDIVTVTGPGATETQAPVQIPADENWYTMEITTVDIAGNSSTTTITRNYLVDAEVPAATISSTTITGTNSSISGTVTDNIQVRSYDSRFLFALAGVPGALPFSGVTAVDETLDNSLTGSAAATGSSSLVVRSIQQGVAGAAILPTQYGFGVFDMANNFGFNGAAIAFGAGNGVANTNSLAVTATPGTICRTGTAAACTTPANTSTALQAALTTTTPGSPTTPFANPVARVYYYFQHYGADAIAGNGDDYLVLIGSTDASAATVETNATNGVRTFRFNHTLAASALPAVGTFAVHAVAVDAEGDAILVSTNVVVE